MNKTDYTYIRQLYTDYLDTDEYNNHPLFIENNEAVQATEPEIEKLFLENTKISRMKAFDLITGLTSESEETGFILGFSYALHFISEANQVKGDMSI